jgi:hypothetical protein
MIKKLTVLLLSLTIFFGFFTPNYSNATTKKETKRDTTVTEKIDSCYIKDSIKKDSTKNELVSEVQNYLDNIGAPQGVHAASIVDICLKNDFDICFLLAQGTLETNMGNSGMGSSRNSMFGFYRASYTSKNEAIKHYVKTVKTNYLGQNKTVKHLMKNYISKSGHRYAERGYETKLKKVYKNIASDYKIKTLQNTL